MDTTKNNFIKLKTGTTTAHEILSYVTEIEDDINAALCGRLEIQENGKFNKLTAADVRRALFARARARGSISICIQNVLLESLYKLEQTSGIAGFISVLTFIHLIKYKMNSMLVGDTSVEIDVEEELHNISSLSRRVSKDIAFKSIRKYINNPLSSSIILQACNMTGHNGQLYIDKDYTASTSLEITNGYTFPFRIEENFALSTRTKEWKEYGVKVLIIDGIIESVGEINRVLEYFNNEKRPGVIIARGFNDEVLGTLSVNKSRDTLNVVPVLVPYDLEGINALVDLAVVAGTDVISSLKGDVISGIDPHDIITVDKVILNNQSIIISNKDAAARVKKHVNSILDQKETTYIDDKKDLLDKRTKALSSVCTNIKLASNLDNKDAVYLQIQHGINMLKQICRYGMISPRQSLEYSKNVGIKNMLATLADNEFEMVSARELILGIKTGTSLANSILSSSAYLILDTEVG